MRWEGDRESGNVVDQRGGGGGGGFGGGRPIMLGGGMGAGGLIILLLLVCSGIVDPQVLLMNVPAPGPGPRGGGGGGPAIERRADPREDRLAKFSRVILADTEDVWHDLFRKNVGRDYQEPKLVLFTDQVQSACGYADAAVGPFYCPEDRQVYLDLGFFQELERKLNAPGDFAQAYVIAHEIGHHVQNQLGISSEVQRLQARASKSEANHWSVRLELQADYLAGVWAHHAQRTKQILEEGDVEEAFNAAQQIGDDKLQRQARGYVRPDSFTHGSSAQRLQAFRDGLKTGDFSREKLRTYFDER